MDEKGEVAVYTSRARICVNGGQNWGMGSAWQGVTRRHGLDMVAAGCSMSAANGMAMAGARWSVGVEKGGLVCENLARRISRRGLKRDLQGILRRRSRVAHPRCRKNPLAAARMRRGWRRSAAGCRSNTHLWGTGAVERGAGWLRTRGPPRLYECLPPPLWGFGSMLRKGRVKRVYDMGHGSYRSAIDLGDPLG